MGTARVITSNTAMIRGSMLYFTFLLLAYHASPVCGRQKFRILAPVRPYLHEGLQKHLLAHTLFHFPPRQRADLLKRRSARADQDGFLPLTFDVDGRGDPQQRWSVLPLIHHYRHR